MQQQRDNRAVWFVIFILFVLIAGDFVYFQIQISKIGVAESASRVSTVSNLAPVVNNPDACGTACKDYIDRAINEKIKISTGSGVSQEAKTQIVYSQAPQPTRVTYLTLTGGSTRETDWTTIDSSLFTLNIGDYGSKPYAT